MATIITNIGKSIRSNLTTIIAFTMSLVFAFSGFTAPLLTAHATWTEAHTDTWNTAGSFVYRNSNTSTKYPVSVEINYINYPSAYNSSDNTTDYINLLSNISQIEFGMYNTSGNLASDGTARNYIFVRFGAYNSTTKAITFDIGSLLSGGTETHYSTITLPLRDDEVMFPRIMVSFDIEEGVVGFRWGYENINSVYVNAQQFATNDAGSSTYNAGFKFYQGISTNGTPPTYTAKSTSSISSSAVVYTLNNVGEIAQDYFDSLIMWYYDSGYQSGYLTGYGEGQLNPISSVLFDAFATIIGILGNFVMVFLTLEIFDVSILSVFGVIAGIAGIVFILKLVRG